MDTIIKMSWLGRVTTSRTISKQFYRKGIISATSRMRWEKVVRGKISLENVPMDVGLIGPSPTSINYDGVVPGYI